jgi:hypothetical protein
MDAPFHSSSNDTGVGRVRPQRPEISLSSQGDVLVPASADYSFQKEQTFFIVTGDKLITSVNDTGENYSPVLSSQEIN